MSLHVEVPLSNAAEICKYVTVKSHRFRSPPHAFHSRTNKKILLISKQIICTELKPDLGLGIFLPFSDILFEIRLRSGKHEVCLTLLQNALHSNTSAVRA